MVDQPATQSAGSVSSTCASSRGRPGGRPTNSSAVRPGRFSRAPVAIEVRVVLKGGVLLAAYNARRPTRDIDFAATSIANDLETIRSAVVESLQQPLDDGIAYEPTQQRPKSYAQTMLTAARRSRSADCWSAPRCISTSTSTSATPSGHNHSPSRCHAFSVDRPWSFLASQSRWSLRKRS